MTITSSLSSHMDAFLLAVASSTDNLLVGLSVGLSTSTGSGSAASVIHNKSQSQQHQRQRQRQYLARFYKVNLVVALCNAAGTLIATYGGVTLRHFPEYALQRLASLISTSSSPETYVINISIESLFAALAFAYLAWKELMDEGDNGDDHHQSEDDKDKDKERKKNTGSDKHAVSYQLALPMTLNNLAGGIAGGVLGLTVWQTTIYAFLVSFGSMALGHATARRLSSLVVVSSPSASTKWCKYLAILIYLSLSLHSLFQV